MSSTLTRRDLADRWRMTPRQAAAIVHRVNPQFELRINARVYRYRPEDVEEIERAAAGAGVLSSPRQEPAGLPENRGNLTPRGGECGDVSPAVPTSPPAEAEPEPAEALPSPHPPCPQHRAAESGSGGVAHRCLSCNKTINPGEGIGSFHDRPVCNPLLAARRRETA